MPFGDSDTLELRSEAYVAGLGGEKATLKVKVAGRREFAGYWEYLLDNAIFTVPAYPLWGGSALIGQDGSLLGIGSLLVQEALGPGAPAFPGNMYVPINRLKPIFEELVSKRPAVDAAASLARPLSPSSTWASSWSAASPTAARPIAPACSAATSCMR